jgi:membrane associated rhomboid family serine protease
MGIYDRDYYRGDGPSYLGSFLERGRTCKWLIGINVVVFLVQMVTRVAVHQSIPGLDDEHFSRFTPTMYEDGSFTQALLLDPNKVLHGEVWRLFTSMFLHSTNGLPYHLLFNMLFLWWFGTDVEDLYGWREFLCIYLGAGMAGSVLYVLTALPVPPELRASALGASGAVTGVMVLCAIHYPYRTIYLMWIIPVPLWLFVVGSIALDAYTLFNQMQTGVAVACHLGGAAFAFGYYKTNIRLTNFVPDLRNWKLNRRTSRLRVYREDQEDRAPRPQPVGVAATPSSSPSLDDEQLEAKMDAVLEKISRVGKENITDSEREVLLRAAERLKKRRT